MMECIDPTAPKTNKEVQRIRNENQKERIAPYRPSIDPDLAKLFKQSTPDKKGTVVPSIVDWGFLDRDDGQPGEPADWVKKNIQCLERWGRDDEFHQEMIADMKNRHRWTRNIPPPSAPKRYDPSEPPFAPPPEIIDNVEGDDENNM